MINFTLTDKDLVVVLENTLRELPHLSMAKDCLAVIKQLQSELQSARDEIDKAVNERDRAEDMADKLADAIEKITGKDVGEHSNLNQPWGKALEFAGEYLLDKQSASQIIEAKS